MSFIRSMSHSICRRSAWSATNSERSLSRVSGVRRSWPSAASIRVRSSTSDRMRRCISFSARAAKTVFSNAMPQGGPGGAGGPPPSDDSSQNSDSSSSSSSSDDLAKLLTDFLQSLKNSNSSQSYGQSGDTLISQISSLTVDYKA